METLPSDLPQAAAFTNTTVRSLQTLKTKPRIAINLSYRKYLYLLAFQSYFDSDLFSNTPKTNSGGSPQL